MDDLANILAAQVTEKLEVAPGAGIATPAMKEALYKWIQGAGDREILINDGHGSGLFIQVKLHLWAPCARRCMFGADVQLRRTCTEVDAQGYFVTEAKALGGIYFERTRIPTKNKFDFVWDQYEAVVRAIQSFQRDGPCTKCDKPCDLMPGHKVCVGCFVESSVFRAPA